MKKALQFFSLLVCFVLFSTVVFAFELTTDFVSTYDGQTTTSKMYMKDTKVRVESAGQPFYSIIRSDKKVMWMVSPAEKTYMEMPFDQSRAPKTDEKFKGEISRRLLGKETIDRHPTEKYEVVYNENGKDIKVYQWIAKDINNFPIKLMAVDGSWMVEYKNIKTSAPDNVFEVPAGYTKTSMPAMPNMQGMERRPAQRKR